MVGVVRALSPAVARTPSAPASAAAAAGGGPWWEDACQSLAVLAAFHPESRGEVSRVVKAWLAGGAGEAGSGARVAAWLSHSPKVGGGGRGGVVGV